jgi:hypothetical protein
VGVSEVAAATRHCVRMMMNLIMSSGIIVLTVCEFEKVFLLSSCVCVASDEQQKKSHFFLFPFYHLVAIFMGEFYLS